MTENAKMEAGQTGARTVLQLQPVHYKITFLYLGQDRIAHDANYNCVYELQRDTVAINNKPDLIGNAVTGDSPDAASLKAATPTSQGGDTTNPTSDQMFRVMIVDNHALRGADTNLLGRPQGDSTSKPANYRTLGWMKDVSPALPFRVVVKKFVGDQQVDFDQHFVAIFELKDPVEKFDQNDGRRLTYLQGFFAKYNKGDNNPDTGNDNALVKFSGKRASNSAIKATDVLKDVTYASPPVCDTAPGGTNNVQFSSLSAAPAHGSNGAQFTIVARDDGNGTKVGMTDLAFVPPPVAGDNYRILITLAKSDGTDVRDTHENGAAVTVVDDADAVIPKPRAYTTGQFIVWKRTDFRLIILVNNCASADVQWATLQAMYQKAFLEVPQPPAGNFFNLTLATWRAELRREFDPANADARFDNNANFTPALYAAGMFPPFIQPSVRVNNVTNICKKLISHGCANTAPAVNPTPDVDTNQANLVGMFMVLFKLSAPLPGSVVGMYFGDRSFWFAKDPNAATTTNFLAHEFGHGLYLRHSHTGYPLVGYTDAGGTASSINLANGRANNNIHDHDQADGFDCLMAYTGPVTAEPCGLCSLAIRGYDRVEITKQTNYGNQSMSGLFPVTLVVVTVDATGTDNLNETIGNLAVGATMDLMAVGPQVTFTDIGGPPPLQGRVNLSCSADNPGSLWSHSGAGGVTIVPSGGTATSPDNRVTVTGQRAGRVTVTFTLSGRSASASFNVT